MEYNEITGSIIQTAIDIHRNLGPGLLESVYHEVLYYELKKKLHVEKEVPIPVNWEEVRLDVGFRADLIVADKVIVELKAVEKVADVHKSSFSPT